MGSATLVKTKIRLNFKFLFYNLFCVVLLVTLGPVLWALRSIYVIAYDDHITGIKELIISLIFIAVSFWFGVFNLPITGFGTFLSLGLGIIGWGAFILSACGFFITKDEIEQSLVDKKCQPKQTKLNNLSSKYENGLGELHVKKNKEVNKQIYKLIRFIEEYKFKLRNGEDRYEKIIIVMEKWIMLN